MKEGATPKCHLHMTGSPIATLPAARAGRSPIYDVRTYLTGNGSVVPRVPAERFAAPAVSPEEVGERILTYLLGSSGRLLDMCRLNILHLLVCRVK